jgi:outer membrane protein assembly factor BamB
LSTGRAVGRLVAAAVLVAANLALLVTVLLPWSLESRHGLGEAGPAVPRAIIDILLGPLLSALALPRLWRGRPPPSLPAAPVWPGARLPGRPGRDQAVLVAGTGGALVAAVVTGWGLAHLDLERGLRPAATVATAAAAAAVLAWMALCWLTPGPLRPGRARVAGLGAVLAAVVVAALVVATVPVVRWQTTGRYLRHSTAAALPAVPDAPPRRLDRVGWQARIDATEDVPPVLTGRYVLVPERLGVRALDAVTGTQQWNYLRADVRELIAAEPTADGRTTVLLYVRRQQVLGVGVDTATGALRWQRWYPPDTLPRYGPMIAVTGSLLIMAESAGKVDARIQAVSGTDGRIVWTASTGPGCSPVSPPAIAGSTVAYAEHCPGRSEHAAALSAVDGRRLWTWPAGSPGQPASMNGDGALRAVPGGLLASYSSRSHHRDAALLDPATGAVRAAYTAPGRWPDSSHLPDTLALLAGDSMLYLGVEAAAVDPRTGRTHWARALPSLAGWHPLRAVRRGDLVYALLLAEPSRNLPAPPLRLLGVRTDTGDVTVDIPLQPRRCGPDCGPARATLLLAGPGVLVVDEAAGPNDEDVCFLSAIG